MIRINIKNELLTFYLVADKLLPDIDLMIADDFEVNRLRINTMYFDLSCAGEGHDRSIIGSRRF
jgi:hypothetical protein